MRIAHPHHALAPGQRRGGGFRQQRISARVAQLGEAERVVQRAGHRPRQRQPALGHQPGIRAV